MYNSHAMHMHRSDFFDEAVEEGVEEHFGIFLIDDILVGLAISAAVAGGSAGIKAMAKKRKKKAEKKLRKKLRKKTMKEAKKEVQAEMLAEEAASGVPANPEEVASAVDEAAATDSEITELEKMGYIPGIFTDHIDTFGSLTREDLFDDDDLFDYIDEEE